MSLKWYERPRLPFLSDHSITAATSAEREDSRKQASEELFNPLILATAAAAPTAPRRAIVLLRQCGYSRRASKQRTCASLG
jgi:hypothetical protein